MIELYPDIPQQLRDYAKLIWQQASQMSPENASNLLNVSTEVFEKEGLSDESNFLRFYFNLQMERMKE